jgi:hypothetical protein
MEYVIGALILFLGGVVQGTAAFGLALTTAPVLLLVIPHQAVPPVLVTLGLINNLLVLMETRREVRPRTVTPLALAGFAGLPLGAYMLAAVEPGPFKLAVGVIVILAALALLSGIRIKVREGWASLLPVGLMSGILGGSTSLSGPPVILFFANQQETKQSFRGNLIAYFTLLNIASMITFWAFGLMTRQVWLLASVYLLPLLVGTFAGMWIARRTNEKVFKRAVLGLICMVGLILIATNIHGLRG